MAPPTAIQKAIADRGTLTMLLNIIDAAVQANAAAPLDLNTVNNHIERIGRFEVELIEAHKTITASAPADIADHDLIFNNMFQLIINVNIGLQGIKALFPDPVVIPVIPIPHQVIQAPTEIRLPPIKIREFDGKIEEWASFRDLFLSAVHAKASISKVQKMTYLQTLIQGEASKQIRNMAITEANYDIAWQQLQDRYQNERELVIAIIRNFMNQPSLQQPSASSIHTLVDTSNECLRSLEVLQYPKDKGMDVFIFYIIQSKLDQTTKELWDQSLKDTKIPESKTLIDFLNQRASTLSSRAQVTTKSQNKPAQDNRHHQHHNKVSTHHGFTSASCKCCSSGNSHPLFTCSEFHSMSVPDRFSFVKRNNLCFNCLQSGHSTSSCSNKGRCRTCQQQHHTLIHKQTSTGGTKPTEPATKVKGCHVQTQIIETKPIKSPSSSETSKMVSSLHSQNSEAYIKQTLLATALILVTDHQGQLCLCRALLDNGSESSFITEECLKRLGLVRSKVNAELVGISSTPCAKIKGITNLRMKPHFTSLVSYDVSVLVLPKITGRLPSYPCDASSWTHLKDLQLADPFFNKSSPIDILLGADIYPYLIQDGRRMESLDTPIAIRSTIGWLISGNMGSSSNQIKVHLAETDLDKTLQKFWEIESLPTKRSQTSEEIACEEHFSSTHVRDTSGRFMVSIPWKTPLPPIGSSRDLAIRRLKQIEKRLIQNQSYCEQYHDFMNEYLSMNHMELVPNEEVEKPLNPTFYLPHHFVLKSDSTTTKFRVVFDGSAKSSTGHSLYDAMMVGPTLQDNLVDIVTRFRCHPIAFTADIAKMYRQILVTPKNADMQRIVWRDSPEEPVREYRLLTVTYGTASAPYLATKALQQVAHDEVESYPIAANCVHTSFYVDDLMAGAPTLEKAVELRDQLIDLTNCCKFPLRKWYSNDESLIKSLPTELQGTTETISIEIDQTVKALGIMWNTSKDCFQFKASIPESEEAKLTKRIILSEMSRLFDPLGWLSPILIAAKILMQSLWKLNLGWDVLLPAAIQREWSEFKSNLKYIDKIIIPRCLIPSYPFHLRLAGFCDASEKAYGAVIFLCSYFNDRSPVVSLVSSKTRVAPAKQVSLPRLELCGAHLLSLLLKETQIKLNQNIDSIFAWTDSTVVLAWIKAHPSRWKTFIANRVAEIQTELPLAKWYHVKGEDNPADCASRGLSPIELQQHSLWWNGPSWLKVHPDEVPSFNSPHPDDQLVSSEERHVVFAAATKLKCDVINFLLNKYSSLIKLKRVLAFVMRYINNCNKNISHKATGPLTSKELEFSLKKLIKYTQNEYFLTDINSLKKKLPLSSKSSILSLHPFLDEDGLLRVGGRIRHSPLTQDQKHPILIPRHSNLTNLLIRSTHLINCHAGTQLTLATLSQKFWIIRGRDAVRFLLKKCVKCTRHASIVQQQLMGDLPSARVTPTRPFLRCGVDFAGPFLLRPVPVRSKITFKAYLALFVCFVTRAIHLEVVTSLSTDAFLAAFKRFSSRRGCPSDVFSDCGTNFIGANKELKDVQEFLKSNKERESIINKTSNDGITWHFNPPGAPHFGGLWEAGVKSVKFHLRRVLGDTRLTLEEMSTITCQIEACLNSRPLTPMSADPEDLAALTPGHFLIGAPLNAVPESDLMSIQINRLSRWQLLQRLQQQFWKRWSSEFLTRLQQRPKWLKSKNQIKLNDLVLIKNELMSPQTWKMGRVISLHPGADGNVRVVTLRTADGPLKRPIVKLCLLPLDDTITTTDEVL